MKNFDAIMADYLAKPVDAEKDKALLQRQLELNGCKTVDELQIKLDTAYRFYSGAQPSRPYTRNDYKKSTFIYDFIHPENNGKFR